jgi:hypothetical protein
MSSVTVVGLGPGDPAHVTRQTLEAIEAHEHRYLRTSRHPSSGLVGAATTFDDVYESADTFADVYAEITDRLVAAATEHERILYAVPGSPLDPRARGPNELLRQGAILCEGIEDIDRAFNTLRTLREPAADPMRFDGDIDDAFLDRVAALLSPTPTPRDEIARALNAPVSQVAAALLELSLTGRADLLPGGLAST